MNLSLLVGLGAGIVFLSFHYIGFYTMPIVGFVVVMIIENMRKPLGIALIAELSEDEAMASVLSVTSQAKSLIAAILAALTGLAADLWGLNTGIILISMLLLVLYPLYRLKAEKIKAKS